MASPTRWIWVWVNSGSWWWTRRPGVLQFMGSQRLRHDWGTKRNWYYNIKPLDGALNSTQIFGYHFLHCLLLTVISSKLFHYLDFWYSNGQNWHLHKKIGKLTSGWKSSWTLYIILYSLRIRWDQRLYFIHLHSQI